MTEKVEFAGAGVRLSGNITWPASAPAHPGVVLVGGSGPADRHNGGFFDALRDQLTAAGVAVLAYDKRGTGGSSGAWAGATADELAQDAAAALAVLRSHPGIAAGRAGVLGHSEGGWVALRLCTRPGPPPWLILNSCPAVPFLEAEISGLAAAGVPRDLAAALLGQLAAAARAGRGSGEGRRILAACQDQELAAVLRADGFSLDEDTWSQLRAWADYDPRGDLLRLTAATLVVFGEDDPLCPVAASVSSYQETAARAGRAQRIAVFPGAGHRLQAGGSFAPGYLDLLGSWCRAPGVRASG